MLKLSRLALFMFFIVCASHLSAQEEFVGPFASWQNAKTQCGAAGNGTTDDTSALQSCINGLGGSYDVVYLPAGAYKITSTLAVTSKQFVTVVGADPSTVTLKWAGGASAMLVFNGTTRSRIGRITFDGSSAGGDGFAVDRTTGSLSATNIEVADCIFKNLQRGIRGSHVGGSNDSEVSIYRCKFVGTVYGISTQAFNTDDYWVWDSTFQNNTDALTNIEGAGQFHAYRCLFLNSSDADIRTANTSFFGLRWNTSSGSNRFYLSAQSNHNAGAVTFQGNKVLDTTQTDAIQIGTAGPIFLIDNVIRSRSGVTAPAVTVIDQGGPDIMAIGNTYTVSNPVDTSGAASPRYSTQDDQLVSYSSISGSLPTMPGAQPNNSRTVVDIGSGSGASAIQSAVNNAVIGTRTVVHLAKGTYNIASTITTPANSDVQVVGDGYGSILNWTGTSGGVMFSLSGPSKVTLREIQMIGPAEDIRANISDAVGSRVHGDGLQMEHINGNCIFSENAVNAAIDFRGSNLLHQTDNACVQVTGAGPGIGTSTVARYGGTIGSNAVIHGPQYAVTNGGRVLEEEVWYEGDTSRFIYQTSSDYGAFTFQSGKAAPTTSAPVEDFIRVSGFHGNLTILGILHDFHTLTTRMAFDVASQSSDTNVLYSGNMCCEFGQAVSGGAPSWYTLSGSGGVVTLTHNKNYGADAAWQIPDNGMSPTVSFMRAMLAQIRTAIPTPDPPPNTASGVDDVRIYRVNFVNSTSGLHIKSSGGSVPPAPSPPTNLTAIPN